MLICSSWMASQSLPANSSKMAAWAGAPPTKGRPSRAPEKQCQKRPHATSKAPEQVPRAVSPAAENGGRALRRLVPLAGRGVAPRQAPQGVRASGASLEVIRLTAQTLPPARPPAAPDEALLCAEAGASSPEEHGRRPGEAEGLTLLVKGFSGAGHPPLGPVPVQIAVLTATTTTAVRRRETENVRYF